MKVEQIQLENLRSLGLNKESSDVLLMESVKQANSAPYSSLEPTNPFFLHGKTFEKLSNDAQTYSKLDSTVTKIWSIEKEAYDSYVRYYSYDNKGQREWTEYFLQEETGSIARSRTENSYYNDGSVKESIYYSWGTGNNDWIKSHKFAHNYDEHGNGTFLASYTWNSEIHDWSGLNKSESVYDENGNQILFTMSNWDLDAHDWENSFKTESIYSEDGTLSKSTVYAWDSDLQDWRLRFKREYTYDENITRVLNYIWVIQSSSWRITGKDERWREKDGLYSSYTTYDWDFIANDWRGKYKRESHHNESGIEILTVEYDFSDETNDWAKTNKYERIYDEDERRTQFIDYYWNIETNSWVRLTVYEYTYNENGKLFLVKNSKWDSLTNSWFLNSERTFYRSVYFERIAEITDVDLTFGEKRTLPVFEYFALYDERELTYDITTLEGKVSASMENDTLSLNALENEQAIDSVNLTIHLSPTTSLTVAFQVILNPDAITGLVEEKRTYQVYPNVFDNYIEIQPFSNSNTYTAQISDLHGRVHLSARKFEGHQQFDLSELNKGIYLLQIQSLEGKSVYKLVKQ